MRYCARRSPPAGIRPLLHTSVPLFAAVLALLAPALAAGQSSGKDIRPVRPHTVSLTDPADRIIPAGAGTLAAIRTETGDLQLIDVGSGRITETDGLAPNLVGVVAAELSDGIRFYSLAGEPGRYDLAVHRVVGDSLEPVERAVPLPAGLRAPAVRRAAAGAVVWDSAAGRDVESYRVFGLKGPSDVFAKLYPADMLNVGLEQVLLGVHPAGNQVSMIRVLEGFPEDVVEIRNLSPADPSRLATFVPDALYGGSGDAVFANPDAGVLTVVSVQGGSLPRLSTPLQIGFRPSNRGGTGPLLAGDRNLATILIGAAASERLQVFGRSKGGLQAFEPLSAPFPIRDIAVLHGAGVSDTDVFAFLSEDGARVHLTSIDALRAGLPEGYAATSETEPESAIGAGDIRSVQRVLATLGYSVGAIDGQEGPITRAALRAYQYKNGLPVSGQLDDPTVAALNESIGKIRLSSPPADAEAADYESFLRERVPGFEPARLLTLGFSHSSPASPCFGLNAMPPPLLWENSVPLARLLKDLETEVGAALEITSAYRTPAYNRCINDVPTSRHLDFAAVDVRLPKDSQGTLPGPEPLVAALEMIRRRGDADPTVDVIRNSVHIALPPAVAPATRPTVYLQFDGTGRSTAQELSRRLAERGFVLPGEEQVSAATGRREVRFFHAEDERAAELLSAAAAAALREIGIPDTPPMRAVDFTGFLETKPGPGILELWVGF